MDLTPDINEVIRYLGYRGAVPDDSVRAEIKECIGDLQREVTPRFVYEKFPLSVKTEQDKIPLLCLGNLEIRSRDLARNLAGCCGAYLMAVTLGPGPDRLIRRASVSQMSRAVILVQIRMSRVMILVQVPMSRVMILLTRAMILLARTMTRLIREMIQNRLRIRTNNHLLAVDNICKLPRQSDL